MARAALTPSQRAAGARLVTLLRRARADSRTSQAQLASLSGVSVDTIRKLERNAIASPSFFTVVQLARGLGVELDLLAAEVLDELELG